MAHLQDSYGGTSGAEGDLGLASLGCLLRCVLDGLAVLCAAAAVLPCATVSRTCHGGRMAPCLLVGYTLAKTVVLFTSRVRDAVHARRPCVTVAGPLTLRVLAAAGQIRRCST